MTFDQATVGAACVIAFVVCLRFILREKPLKLESLDVTSRGKMFPECLSTVTVTDDCIRHDLPNGQHEEIQWADLTQVDIETTDEGPMLPDVFWVLIGKQTQCVIAQGATGEQALVERLQQLPGFDNHQMSKAMGSTSNQRFVCWQRVEQHA